MSKSSLRQQQLQLQQQQQQQQMMADNEAAALAAEMFDVLCAATTMRQILGLYRNMCDTIGLRPGPINEFYPKLKQKIRSWKAQALWKKFDIRASHRVYNKGNACTGSRVLVIGAGPCGLRAAIEAQLLGAKVCIVEKRDRISRNNVVHLWPFVITDLKNLGAKKFYGKFCAGSIDHISIRQLQCILLKVALLLGVEIHEGVSFLNTIEPSDDCGWRAEVTPTDHAVSHYEFDVLFGADGKRNTLEGFKRKEFRGKLAIAITANFINKKTEAEARAEEISGVAFIFNQSFFKELYQTTGIDLENIVYYKDETHYFVMTAKKHSLIDKNVIIQDFADPAELLSPQNVNTDKLLDYAREAAEFSTKYQMPNLEFAVNHYGKPDVAMFDFTSMFAAEASSRVIVRKNYRLLQCLVGDSLLEPFWPTGSGCARGFLSSMDAAYMIKLHANQRNSILGILAQRESIYRLLAQTTPENLQRDIGAYTVDPATRYPNLNKSIVNVWQVKHLIDTDDPNLLEQVHMDTNALQQTNVEMPIRRKRRTGDLMPLSTVLLRWIKAQLHAHEFSQNLTEASECITNGQILCALINRYRPELIDLNTIKDLKPIECNELAFKIFETELNIPRCISAKQSMSLENVDSKIWLNYLEQICEGFRGEIPQVKHPKLDYFELKEKSSRDKKPDFSHLLNRTTKTKAKSPMQDIDLTANVHRRSILDEDKARRQRKNAGNGIESTVLSTGHGDTSRRAKKRRSQEKTTNIDRDRGIQSAFPRSNDENFSNRIKSMEQQITSRTTSGTDKKPKDLLRAIGKIDSNDWNIREIEKKIEQSKKTEIPGKSKEKVPKWSKEQFLARQNKMSKPPLEREESTEEKFKEIDQTLKNLDKQLKEGSIREIGERGKNKVASIAGQFGKKDDTSDEKPVPQQTTKSSSKVSSVFKNQSASEKCHFCKQTVYLMEKIATENLILHRSCLKCHHCHTNLRLGAYAFDRDDPVGRFYCTQHFRLPAKAIRPMGRKSTKQQKKSTAAVLQSTEGGDSKTTDQLVRGRPDTIAQLDLLDRGQTPERIEFENADAMSDGEPSLENIIDENEWTDRNFVTDSDDSESDLSSSDESDDESESFEDADDGSPIAQTLQLATDWIGKQRYSNGGSEDSDNDFYDSSDGMLDENDADSQTEGEEFKKAREMRRQEVKLLPIPTNLPTDTETEVQSDSESSSADDDVNSATEISTDSEFDHDPVIRETPKIFIDDTHLRKPTKVQIKQVIIGNNGTNHPPKLQNVTNTKLTSSALQNALTHQELEFKPLVQVDPSLLNSNRIMPLKNPRSGDYLLNKTASTEGIACKTSLELKKRYLLGGEQPGIGNKIMKSGSTSILDTKLKSFHSNISECQKRLNAASDISVGMRSFLDRTTKLSSNDIIGMEKKKSETEMKLKKDLEEKENVFVNSKNELNKGMEYSETVNTALIEHITKNPKTIQLIKLPSPIIETIDLISPEKEVPNRDLKQPEFNKCVQIIKNEKNTEIDDSIEIIDLTYSPPMKILEKTNDVVERINLSKNNKQPIPDIIKQAENIKFELPDQSITQVSKTADSSPITVIKTEELDNECQDTCIQVPQIPWPTKKTSKDDVESDSLSTSSSTSSLEDIPHYILESTTSPDTQNCGNGGIVPRLEIHDSSGALMQIDSLMIIDGKYIGDPEDLPLMEIPEGMTTSTPTITEATTIVGVTESMIVEPLCDKSFVSKQSNNKNNNQIPIVSSTKDLKFDSKNENKIESLKNLPLIYDKSNEDKKPKPQSLDLGNTVLQTLSADTKLSPTTPTPAAFTSDNDKTPTANDNNHHTDSETEQTGQLLTETELSDWTADDAVSENFVDIEFVLNSNKGTIKRNKKGKKGKLNSKSGNIQIKNTLRKEKCSPTVQTPREGGGILENLAIGEIDFMDTGSEGSCAETYDATNNALIKNRGYIEFIENTAHNEYSPTTTGNNFNVINLRQSPKTNFSVDTKSYKRSNSAKEILGIDYIEQGACILNSNVNNSEIDLKTPVNEVSPPIFSIGKPVFFAVDSTINQLSPKLQLQQPQSLTDSTNELDDDSLVMMTSQSGTNTNTTTTTEESEALTVVTSPLDSSSPRTQGNLITTPTSSSTATSSVGDINKIKDVNKTLSSNSNNKTPSKCSNEQQHIISSNRKRSSQEDLLNSTKRKDSDEMSYEEYVRKLQQKITQISNAKDSIDVRKHKRKTSRCSGGGELSVVTISELERTEHDEMDIKSQTTKSIGSDTKGLSIFESSQQPVSLITNNSTKQENAINQHIHKVPEIPTLSSKLEEITKERTKQKDLIHDLVMDKLQSKKQLNAEKRLNRNRNRSSIFSPRNGINDNNLMISSTPKLVLSSNNGCTNNYNLTKSASEQIQNFKENIPNKKKNSSPSENKDIVDMFHQANVINRKSRPLSDNLDKIAINYHNYEQSQSNSGTTGILHNSQSKHANDLTQYVTPKTTTVIRSNHNFDETRLAANTGKLKAEARARARLKTNQDLGLSPEEKLQILRKRYHLDLRDVINVKNTTEELRARQRKMITSKSVNDISLVQQQQPLHLLTSDENFNTTKSNTNIDFTSDPNLSNSINCNSKPDKLSRRHKDPERRKSLIQTFSSFFNKGKKDKDTTTATLCETSPTKDKEYKQSVEAAAVGVFSRFRISPKAKDKSKEKDETPPFEQCNLTQDCLKHEFSSTPHLFNNNNKNIDDTALIAAASGALIAVTATPGIVRTVESIIDNYEDNDDDDDDEEPPPIPPLPLNYQRSDDESYTTAETREYQKKQRAISKASRQAELKRIRIAQEIQREQEEIEVQLKEYEARGVIIEKALRGEGQNIENLETSSMGASDEKLLKELLEIWRNITQLKKRDEELGIRQQELKLEHRHAQLKDELNMRLSCGKLDKSSADVAAEGAILNEMLEIVAKRAALRPNEQSTSAGSYVSSINRQSTSNESEVSLFWCSRSIFDFVLVFAQFSILYAFVLFYAFTQ